jgi:RimJ/RimL family protein N-acetyltransferase
MEPSQYEVPASLKDGTEIIIRAIRPDDSGPLREQFVRHLSTESVRLRFHGLRRAPTESEAFRLTNIDFVDHVALVATPRGNPRELIGVARYIVDEDRSRHDLAEVAFLVLDEYQGKGVGTLLLKHLAILAKTRGIHVLRADVLADNQAMLRVIEQSGFPVRRSTSFGVVQLVLSITEEAVA